MEEYEKAACWSCKESYEFLKQDCGREWNCPHCGVKILLKSQSQKTKEQAETWMLRIVIISAIFCCFYFQGLLELIYAIGFVLLILIGIPFSFSKYREKVALSCFFWGYISAACLLKGSFLVVEMLWGKGAAIIGIFCGIVGIIPEAFLACIVKQKWELFFGLAIGCVVTLAAILIIPAILTGQKKLK